jgi:hypothetical protein
MDHLLSREKDKIDTSILYLNFKKIFVLFGFERLI